MAHIPYNIQNLSRYYLNMTYNLTYKITKMGGTSSLGVRQFQVFRVSGLWGAEGSGSVVQVEGPP